MTMPLKSLPTPELGPSPYPSPQPLCGIYLRSQPQPQAAGERGLKSAGKTLQPQAAGERGLKSAGKTLVRTGRFTGAIAIGMVTILVVWLTGSDNFVPSLPRVGAQESAPSNAPNAPNGPKSAITKKKNSAGTKKDGEVQPDSFRIHLVPLLRKYCYDCHVEKKQAAEIAVHHVDNEAAVLAKRSTWEAVLTMIEGQAMPPANHPQPTAAERKQMIRWLESTLFDLDCEQEHDPGRVTIRRLNRVEYNNTIRDLLGVDFRPADDFPSDDVGYGFDNIGDVLSVSPLLVEKYLTSAEKIAAAAVAANIVEMPVVERRQGKDLQGGGEAKLNLFGRYTLRKDGFVTASFAPKTKGAYLIRIRAAASQAGNELAQLQVLVDREPQGKIEVDATPDAPRDYTVRVRLERGDREVKV
ncbi:MAG: DUF1587 domain-containing protein, partial [Planctomycetota bacterium]